MTIFRTCTGCKAHPGPCEIREALRRQLKGLGVTSIKWRCKSRESRFKPGDQVWVLTAADRNDADEHGNPYRDHFPGVIIEERGSKALLHVKDGSPGRDDDTLKFVAGDGRGFCKIPLSRLEPRDAPKERVCFYCSQPESLGHVDGYYCAPPAEARKWVGEPDPADPDPDSKIRQEPGHTIFDEYDL